MKYLQLLLIAVMFYSMPVLALKNFRAGKIITLKGDTLNGYIKYEEDINLCKICLFKDDSSKPFRIFTPVEIRSFQFTKENRKFIADSILLVDHLVPIFMEVVLVGHFRIYHYKEMNLKDHYFINKLGDARVIYLPFKRYYLKETYDHGLNKYSRIITRTTTNHIDSLKMLLSDAPNIFDQIEKIEEPNFKNLKKLLYNYQLSLDQKNKDAIIKENWN